MADCSMSNCGRRAVARKLCGKHYQRWAKHGDASVVLLDREQSVEERFWAKVNKNGPVPDYAPHLGPCWIWTAGLADGYGAFSVDNVQVKAHILSYTWAKGEIADGWHRDHLCRVPACVNPDHLEGVPPQVNTLRGFSPAAANALKTHCPKLHPYDEENTYVNPSGERVCRICARERTREWWNRKRGANRS